MRKTIYIGFLLTVVLLLAFGTSLERTQKEILTLSTKTKYFVAGNGHFNRGARLFPCAIRDAVRKGIYTALPLVGRVGYYAIGGVVKKRAERWIAQKFHIRETTQIARNPAHNVVGDDVKIQGLIFEN